MNSFQVIRAAIPHATEEQCDQILWNRTSFPMGSVTAKSLYKAAQRYERAFNNGLVLCDLCDNAVFEDRHLCPRCLSIINPN